MPNTTDSASAGTTFKKPPRLSMPTSSQPRLLSPTAKSPAGDVKFPRIDECAHFHYETVDCGSVELALLDEAPEGVRLNGGTFDFEKPEQIFWITVKCRGKQWVIRRTADQFKTLDELLHECVYDRRFTQLRQLQNINEVEDEQALHDMMKKYVARLSKLPENQMSCAPVLHWFGMDNRGIKLVAAIREMADINIPAVAAAHTIRRYTAQSSGELSLEVGDMVSIIDMSDSNWWRGKCRLQVGSFPAQCVRRISDAKHAEEVPSAVNLPSSPTSSSPPNLNTSRTKPIVKKHGKFMEFLRSFLVTRPTKSRLKQTGILKERVFGCDLGEYLHNCEVEVPVVVRDCTDFVEKYGIVDGIYRISGVASHVQNLRHEYDCERRPDLNRDPSGRGEQSFCDPHSVAGLCKLYFRELPNPLLTYQLYNRFAAAINAPEDERLLKVHDVIQQLPPPHYRTLKHLALHLQSMAGHDEKTSMHCRNLAIVWAPNLLRSRDLEAGLAAFTEARVQSVVTEFLIANADMLFSDQLQKIQLSRGQKPPRPKSLMVLSGPKLISLEEAQARSKAGSGFSKPSSENFASSFMQEGEAMSNVRRSRKMSSPPGYPHGNSRSSPSCVAVVPLCSGGSSAATGKRRQSMDPKLGRTRQQSSFPSNPRHYSSQHSVGWRSKLGSFLKKSTAGQSESASTTPESKGPLRRSQSDDSMLSSHSSRLDEVEERAETKPLDTPVSLDPPTLRQGSSPRSPRPVGRIFFSEDSLNNKVDDANPSGEAAKTGSTPDGIPTPSLETNPSSHNPFSGLDSDFPGVMGESGLGFNPLQYSPTFSSDSGIPELPLTSEAVGDSTREPGSSTVNGHATQEKSPRKSIGSLGEIKTAKHAQQPVSNGEVSNGASDALSSGLDVDSKIEDVSNADAKVKQVEHPNGVEGDALTRPLKTEKREKFQAVFHALACSYAPEGRVNTNDNNRATRKFAKQKSEDASSPIPARSFYWKTEDVDSLNEIDRLNLRERSDPQGGATQPAVMDSPRSYSVQYACRQLDSNGKTRRSITATFVQDRPYESKIRRPHSIRRSMDVPPPPTGDAAAKAPGKKRSHAAQHHRHHRSERDISRRHRAYTAWVSQHRNDATPLDPRTHCRSLSVGDELDLDARPVPPPRVSSLKPVPTPGHLTRKSEMAEFSQEKADGDDGPATLVDNHTTVSAPTTPADSAERAGPAPPVPGATSVPCGQGAGTKDSSPLSSSHASSATREQSVTKRAEQNKGTASGNFETFLKTKSASGIVSPTDNVCASTVLSWV